MLLISSGGGDQMIFLGLNFQFRDFFGCENLESTFLGGFFFCVCVLSGNIFWKFFEARKFHMGYFGG